jgi:inorganic pyrophosphatase
MEDESGQDAKLLAVPEDKILPLYKQMLSITDVNPFILNQIKHFFEHYKDLEAGKWVKVKGWGDVADAHQEILDGIAGYAKST